jgi:ABC-2 type transport system permease protein
MSKVLTIAKRDFLGFLGTPAGWMAACLIFLVSGLLFSIVTRQLLINQQAVDPVADIMGSILGFLNYINIFVVPIFTMRVMSEELAQGTFRLQAGAPITSEQIVFGKFFGIMFYFGVIAALLLVYPLFAVVFAEPDYSVLAMGYLGFILNIAAIVAIGLFVGSLTDNGVISYLGSVFFIILFLFSAYVDGAPEWYKKSVNILELGNELSRGVLKTSSVAIYASIISIFLFLSRLVVETKRWRV